MSFPFRLGAACCGADGAARAGRAAEGQCPGPVTWCGLVLRQRFDGRPPEAWPAFACDEHDGVLVAARELLDRDRAVLDERRAEERHTYSAERPWRAPQPLATGAEAVTLVERARRWAERQRPTRGE